MAEDMIERLAFLRHEPARALVIGDLDRQLVAHLAAQGCEVTEADIIPRPCCTLVDLAAPYPLSGFDLIAVFGLLDCVNDLPGALIHIRQALNPGGLAIASFVGAGSLPMLRSAMLAGDGERPAARTHPLVDSRAAAGLLQRAGWKDPVVDSHDLTVRYSSLARLVSDLREMGLGNVLASPAPALSKAAVARAQFAFLDNADEDGKVSETLSILTLSGRRSLAGT